MGYSLVTYRGMSLLLSLLSFAPMAAALLGLRLLGFACGISWRPGQLRGAPVRRQLGRGAFYWYSLGQVAVEQVQW